MARHVLRVMLSVLLGLSTLFVHGAAAAVSVTSTTTVTSATVLPGSCFSHPYTVSVAMSSDVSEVTVKVDLSGPHGGVLDSKTEYLTQSTGTSQQFTYSVLLCDGDPLGTYTVTKQLDVYDADYRKISLPASSSSFTYSSPPTLPATVPAPPAPAPTPIVPVVTDVDGAVARVRTYDGRTLKFRLVAFATPAGTVEGRPLAWTFQVDNRKPKKVMQGARDTFTYSREFPFRSGRHRVTVWKNGDRVTTLRIFVR